MSIQPPCSFGNDAYGDTLSPSGMGRAFLSFRVFTVLGLLMLSLAALGIYLVKYRVQDLQKEVAATHSAILHEREATALLTAEWHYLCTPKRIAALQQKYLQLVPLSAKQTVAFGALDLPQMPASSALQHAASEGGY